MILCLFILIYFYCRHIVFTLHIIFICIDLFWLDTYCVYSIYYIYLYLYVLTEFIECSFYIYFFHKMSLFVSVELFSVTPFSNNWADNKRLEGIKHIYAQNICQKILGKQQLLVAIYSIHLTSCKICSLIWYFKKLTFCKIATDVCSAYDESLIMHDKGIGIWEHRCKLVV